MFKQQKSDSTNLTRLLHINSRRVKISITTTRDLFQGLDFSSNGLLHSFGTVISEHKLLSMIHQTILTNQDYWNAFTRRACALQSTDQMAQLRWHIQPLKYKKCICCGCWCARIIHCGKYLVNDL